jgi:FkbM family methyltransferase
MKTIVLKSKDVMAKFLLVKIPRFLSSNGLIGYFKLLSNLQYLLSRRDRIVEVRKYNFGENNWIYEISTQTQDIYIQDIRRISRFWRGSSHAFERLYYQYVYPESGIDKRLEAKKPNVIFDIGANIGEFTIFCAHYFPKAKIYAFEPDPIAFECLSKNIENFGLESRVSIWQLALSDKIEKSTFYVASSSADSSLVKPTKYTAEIILETMRLDLFMANQSIKNISLLKMDAEGNEPEVILGMGQKISNCDSFTIDVSPERGGVSTLNETREILEALQLKTEVITGQGERIFLTAITSISR